MCCMHTPPTASSRPHCIIWLLVRIEAVLLQPDPRFITPAGGAISLGWVGACVGGEPLPLRKLQAHYWEQAALAWAGCAAGCRRALLGLPGLKPAPRAPSSACTHQAHTLKCCLPLYRCCGGSTADETDATSCTGENQLITALQLWQDLRERDASALVTALGAAKRLSHKSSHCGG